MVKKKKLSQIEEFGYYHSARRRGRTRGEDEFEDDDDAPKITKEELKRKGSIESVQSDTGLFFSNDKILMIFFSESKNIQKFCSKIF